MELRRGQWGEFWGCRNYRLDDPNPCKGKVKVDAVPERSARTTAQVKLGD